MHHESLQEAVDARIAKRGTEVLNEDTGKFVVITDERRQRALARIQTITGRLFEAAVGLREMKESEDYLALGFGSWAAFCEAMGISRSHSYRLLDIAETYTPSLLLAPGTVSPGRHDSSENGAHSDSEEAKIIAEHVGELGLKKAKALTDIPRDELGRLIRGEAVTTADGREITLDDIKDASVRDAGLVIKNLREKYVAKSQRDQERAAKAEAERDVYRERLEEAEAKAALAEELERLYGPKAEAIGRQLQLIDDINGHVRQMSLRIDQLGSFEHGVAHDLPDTVREGLAGALRSLHGLHRRCQDNWAAATATL